jgi:hypothetical protein
MGVRMTWEGGRERGGRGDAALGWGSRGYPNSGMGQNAGETRSSEHCRSILQTQRSNARPPDTPSRFTRPEPALPAPCQTSRSTPMPTPPTRRLPLRPLPFRLPTRLSLATPLRRVPTRPRCPASPGRGCATRRRRPRLRDGSIYRCLGCSREPSRRLFTPTGRTSGVKTSCAPRSVRPLFLLSPAPRLSPSAPPPFWKVLCPSCPAASTRAGSH